MLSRKKGNYPRFVKTLVFFSFFCMRGGGQGRGKCGGVGKGCKLKIKRAILKVCVFWCSIRYMRMQVYKTKQVGINFPGLQFLVILCLMIIVRVQWSRRLTVQFVLSQLTFFCHSSVLFFILQFYFFYTVQFFFLHSSFHSSFVFFFHVCFHDRSRRRTKESKLYQGPEWGRCEVLFFHIVY